MMLNWNEIWDYKARRNYWWTQRDAEGRCAEIRKNDNGNLDLLICEIYKSTHNSLQEAMDEAKKYVAGITDHIIKH